MGYKYEMHLHTCQGSACGRATGAEHARFYKERGVQGIFVTDHFFGGNTAAPRNAPWQERVERFCVGFEDAWNEGQKIGLDVFFGWEQTFDGDDYLVYGLDKQFLLDHPEMEHWSRKEQLEQAHAAGGCVLQAHPFRMRDYIWAIHLGDLFCDGWEVANAGNTRAQDIYAKRYADRHGLYQVAGSDNHHSDENSPLFLMELDEKLDSAGDWARHVREQRAHRILCPRDRWDGEPEEPLMRTRRFNEACEAVDLSGDWTKW